jgi:membrane protein implicated in regulation of membrane protease activity
MEAIEYYYLLGFGFLLIGIEIMLFSFYLLWIGLGFIAVSLLSLFINFDNGITQIAIALIIGLVLLVVFKKPLEKTMTAHDDSETAVHVSGMGIITDGAIKMNGTYWQTSDDLSDLKDGDTVQVYIKENRAYLVK